MEIDLERHEARDEPFRSQVCVIGAGIAGLTLAHRLIRRGIDVVLLEAGGRALEDADERLLGNAELRGQPHIGTTEGRSRVYGGSSLRWGGQVLPLPPLPDAADPWPLPADTLKPFYRDAEDLLAIDSLPFEAEAFFRACRLSAPTLLAGMPGLDVRLSKWAAFDHRNFASTFARNMLAGTTVRVYLHAQVAELVLAPQRDRLEAILVRSAAGRVFRFEAEAYVLAAGTVETARLLLASRSVAPEGVGNANDQVGRGFHDHLTLTAATITGNARSTLLRELRPWVFGRTLHSLKLEASSDLRQRLNLNPVLAHVTLQEPEDTGLAVLRTMLHARQRGELLGAVAAKASKLPSALLESVRLLWSAKLHHRRFVSADTVVRLQLNAAQDAPSASRITLSPELDRFGLPLPIVDWRVTPNEVATLRRFASYLRVLFEAQPSVSFAWLPELFEAQGALPGIEDARHSMGGACMGVDPRSSVVDADLGVRGVANLSIASAATFPSGVAQLPTLTLMALSLRLADRIASGLAR